MSDVQDQLQRLLTASRRVIRAASLALPDAVQALAAVVEEIDQADETPIGLLAGLVEWAAHMGGWEDPIWRRAEAMLVRHGRRDPEPAEELETMDPDACPCCGAGPENLNTQDGERGCKICDHRWRLPAAGSCEHCPADGGPCNVCTPPTPAGWGPLST
jgi:hypothetical protein